MKETKISRREISFSQAEGIVSLPQPLALGELPKRVRVRLWDTLYESLTQSIHDSIIGAWFVSGVWKEILFDYHTDFLFKSAEEFENKLAWHISEIRKLVLRKRYSTVFDFIQFVLRHRRCPKKLLNSVNATLLRFNCAYRVIEDGPTIVPISSPEQGKSIQNSFVILRAEVFLGAREHLKKAADFINANNPSASMRESIHAVESVARCIDSKSSTSLGPALGSLKDKGMHLHPAFGEALLKIYGYTSDEDGIRHATIDELNVDMDDAVFLFGACASFSAYLVAKGRVAGLLDQ